MPTPSYNTKEPLPSLDPAEIRTHVRRLIRSLSSFPSRETPRQTQRILNEIWRLVGYAFLHVENKNHAQALLTLQAVTDICTRQWMHLNDFHGDVSAFFPDLASAWTTMFLSIDLTAKERTHWTKQIITWQTLLGDWCIREAFDAPLTALREGWDDQTLQLILQGTSPQKEDEVPHYDPMLIQARLAILEQRKQFQEYLHLAKATGQTQEFVIMLVRQGQITEAIDYGLQRLATAEDALALAQKLFAQKKYPQSFQIAEHGLELEGDRVPLAVWLRDQSWLRGERELALKAGEVAFRSEITLKNYLRIADMAEAFWPEQRAKLLAITRQAPWSADPRKVVHIFLHEHLFEDAIAVLQTKQPYTLVAEVVEAALAEQRELEWVIQECHQQAEHIMNGAKAAYYQGATLWLTRARSAYHMLGRKEEWDMYLDDLLERHKYKSKLLPLLTALKE